MQVNGKNKPQKLLLNKEREKFEAFFLTYYPVLCHYGNTLSTDVQLIEDCIQELFIHLYEKEINLSTIKYLKAYLFTALRRRILEKGQKNNIASNPISTTAIQFSAEMFLIEQEENLQKKQLLATYLNDLPWRQREAVYLKFFNKLPAKEIAEIMGITTQVVTNTVYKALKKLRELSLKNKI